MTIIGALEISGSIVFTDLKTEMKIRLIIKCEGHVFVTSRIARSNFVCIFMCAIQMLVCFVINAHCTVH